MTQPLLRKPHRIYYDTELVERGPELPIQLVSIGMIRDDGKELYCINEECLSNVMRHPWGSVNVVPSLPIRADDAFIYEWDQNHPEYSYVFARDRIVKLVYDFVSEVDHPELWADYSAYDHVAYAQLFGSMSDYPPGLPMFTNDLQQLHRANPRVPLPPAPMRAHHAMDDARWCQEAVQRIHGANTIAIPDDAFIVDADVVDIHEPQPIERGL